MKKDIRECTRPVERNELYDAIEDQFDTVARAARKLMVCRTTVYAWIKKNAVTRCARKQVERLGYNPDTFKPILK